MPRLLDKLTQGDVTQASLTVVEGSTFAEFAATLASSPAIVKTVLSLPESELAQKIGVAATSLEGWFFPDTYFFAAGSADLALLVARPSADAATARRGMAAARGRYAAQGCRTRR